jgi:hypothetical protein
MEKQKLGEKYFKLIHFENFKYLTTISDYENKLRKIFDLIKIKNEENKKDSILSIGMKIHNKKKSKNGKKIF